MAGFYINHPAKKDFIKSIMQAQIKSTGVGASEALMEILPKKVGLSYPTLLKASFGEFTKRTVGKMIQAGWFTADEYRKAQTSGTASTTGTTSTTSTAAPVTSKMAADMNDEAEKQAVIRAAFQRGIEHGFKQGTAGIAVKIAESFARGKAEGFNVGYQAGRASANSASTSPSPQGLPVDKMQSLFNMTTTKGAAHGEQVAARRAVGKMLQKWISDKFKVTVEVDVK